LRGGDDTKVRTGNWQVRDLEVGAKHDNQPLNNTKLGAETLKKIRSFVGVVVAVVVVVFVAVVVFVVVVVVVVFVVVFIFVVFVVVVFICFVVVVFVCFVVVIVGVVFSYVTMFTIAFRIVGLDVNVV
jgi:hypothetical protein